MLKFIAIPVLFLCAVAGVCYYLLYPPSVYKRELRHMLYAFGEMVDTQNRANIRAFTDSLLQDDVHVTLTITYPSFPGQKAHVGDAENFTKPDFLTFLDNTLYSLQDYHFKASADALTLSPDRKHGTFDFSAKASAHDIPGGLSAVGMAFSGDALCHGELAYASPKQFTITQLNCSIVLQ